MAELEACGVHAADLEGWIVASAIVQAAKRAKAEEVKEYWKSIAPERGDKPTHGRDDGPTAYGTNWPEDYLESIQVHEDPDGVITVGSDLIPLADWLEYGSIHNPEHGYGIRVLQHFGGGPVDEGARITNALFIG
ncbi:hypothetical protein [Mycobacterium colombiense]|nr:hypothetical protein [Mycobacterium colombiense]